MKPSGGPRLGGSEGHKVTVAREQPGRTRTPKPVCWCGCVGRPCVIPTCLGFSDFSVMTALLLAGLGRAGGRRYMLQQKTKRAFSSLVVFLLIKAQIPGIWPCPDVGGWCIELVEPLWELPPTSGSWGAARPHGKKLVLVLGGSKGGQAVVVGTFPGSHQ